MPRPRLQKQLVSIPLTSGLSQREDPAHLPPGQAIQITNYVKGKQSTLEKSPGYIGLTTTPTEGASLSYVAAVAAHEGDPLVLATDSTYGPGIYELSETNRSTTLIDRVSEVFVPTPTMIASYQQAIADFDVAMVLTPNTFHQYVVHVWAVVIGSQRIYYKVTDYVTGAVVVPAQEVSFLAGVAGTFVAPKLTTCLVNGTTNSVILTAGLFGSNQIYAGVLNLSTFAWGTNGTVVTDVFDPSVYDVAPVDDDGTVFVMTWERSGSRNVAVGSFNATTLAAINSNNFAIAVWSGGAAHLTGLACRASNLSNGMWLAIAWQTGSGTSTQAFVYGGAQNYPGLASSLATAVDLTNGMTSAYPGPRLLDIKSTTGNVQQVVWSPPSVKVGYDPNYVATPAASHAPPLCAIYQSAFKSFLGAGALMNNQPRWTNGVTLASRIYPWQLAHDMGSGAPSSYSNVAYVVGFMPSNNLNPTWSGVATVATPNVANVTNVAYQPYVTFGGASPFGGSGGRAYGGNYPGGAQADAIMDVTPSVYTSSTAFGSPGGANITNVAVTEPGSGYLSAPTATLNWGVGTLLIATFDNLSAGGVITGVRILDNVNVSGIANITVSGPTVTVNLNSTFGVTATIAGATINISGATHPNNNGTFAVLHVSGGVDGNGLYENVVINNPLAVSENGTAFFFNTNNGGGSNYWTKPHAVPVYIQDVPNNNVYTGLAEALVGTNGANVGIVQSITMLSGASAVKFAGAGAGPIANPNVHVWIPQPNTPAPQFTGATNAAVSAGCFSNVSTTLVEPSGYENIQGSFFVFAIDTFNDFTTPNDTGTPYRNTPMRMVATLKPRLGLNAIMSGAHTLPHWSQAWPTGVPQVIPGVGSGPWGPGVFDLPINVSPTSVGIMQFTPELFPSWALQDSMYVGDELGGLTALAAGVPTLTDGEKAMEFAYPYYPENIYVAVAGPFAPGTANVLYGGSSYQYIATYERMDTVGNTHRSGRSVPATMVTLPTYDDSRYNITAVIPTMGFSPSHHGTNQTNLANVQTQTPTVIQLYRTSSAGSTTGGAATTGGTVFYNVTPTSRGIAQNDLWSPYIVYTDGTSNVSSDSEITTHALLYGDGASSTDQGAVLDNLTPPALQGVITHKNRFWGFEGSNVWYTKAFTNGEGPGFNELMAFSVDDGSGEITALASMDERLIIFKRDRVFYVVGDGPNDNLSSNDLQPPQRIQSDVGCITQASVVAAPSGIYFLSDNGLYQLSRKFEVTHIGAFVDDWIAQYPVITSACLDMQNGRLVWIASKPKAQPLSGLVLTPGSIAIFYSYLWDAWTVEQFDEGSGNYGNFQVTSADLTGSPPTVTVGGNYANTGGPFVLRERNDGSYLTTNSSGQAVYQQSVWQSPWMKASDFQGFARWMLVTLAWYNSDTNQLSVQIDYNYSTSYTQSFTVSAAAMSAAQKANGSTFPIVQWELQPNNPKAESMRITITDKADSKSSSRTGRGSILLALTLTMALKDGTKVFPVAVSQRGTA